MIYAIHAGHGLKGKGTVGAIGLLDESVEARELVKRIVPYIQASGHTAIDCTEDSGKANAILCSVARKTNATGANFSISVHFNAGAKKAPDGKSTGVEVYVYNSTSNAIPMAKRICANIVKLGYKNRGVKVRPTLYVLRKVNMPALLIECCFVDDPDDVKLYNRDAMAKAIAEGILGVSVSDPVTNPSTTAPSTSASEYRVRITTGALNVRAEASSKSAKVTIVKKGDVYTIVETKSGWGKLKSGAGWIYLKYTEKC